MAWSSVGLGTGNGAPFGNANSARRPQPAAFGYAWELSAAAVDSHIARGRLNFIVHTKCGSRYLEQRKKAASNASQLTAFHVQLATCNVQWQSGIPARAGFKFSICKHIESILYIVLFILNLYFILGDSRRSLLSAD